MTSLSKDVGLTLSLLLLHTILCLAAGPSYFASDDLVYAQMAEGVRSGTFQLIHSHFANRFGLFVPEALVFSWFGINPYSTVLWDWFAGQMTLLWLFSALRTIFGRQPAFLATFLLAINPLWIEESLVLGPDVPVTFFTTAALLTLWRIHRSDQTLSPVWHAFLVSGLVLAGILTKLTALWVLPPVMFFLWRDGIQGRHRTFWLWTGGWLLLFMMGYLLVYYLLTGSPWHHFTVVDQAGVVNPDKWSYADKSWQQLLARLTNQPLVMFLENPGLVVPMVLSLPILSGFLLPPEQRQDFQYWRITALLVLLMFWFGTRSYSTYNPMHLIPRTWLPLLPLLCILSGLGLDRLVRWEGDQIKNITLGLTGTFGVLSLIAWGMGRWKMPMLMTMTSLAIPWLTRRTAGKLGISPPGTMWVQGLVMLVLLLVPTVVMIYRGYLGEQPHQVMERLIVVRYLRLADTPVIVDTDSRNVASLSYYLQFQIPPNICLRHPGTVDPCTHMPNNSRQLIFRRHTSHDRSSWERSLQQQSRQEGWRLLESGSGVYLFEKEIASR